MNANASSNAAIRRAKRCGERLGWCLDACMDVRPFATFSLVFVRINTSIFNSYLQLVQLLTVVYSFLKLALCIEGAGVAPLCPNAVISRFRVDATIHKWRQGRKCFAWGVKHGSFLELGQAPRQAG